MKPARGGGILRAFPPDEFQTMSDTPPDRLSNDPRSPHYDEAAMNLSLIHISEPTRPY